MYVSRRTDTFLEFEWKKELIGLLIVRSEEMRNESRRKEKSDEEGKRMLGKRKTRYSHENSFILETEK